MSLEPSARTEFITVERATATTDDYGGEVQTWATLGTYYAQIRYGTGAERRQAAQEGSEQAATFGILRSETSDGITMTDRISYRGLWDITAINPTADRKGMILTAVRSA